MRKIVARLLVLCLVCAIPAASMAQDAQTDPFGAEARYARVATEKGTLNMRARPEDKAKVEKKPPKGAIVHVLEYDGGEWMKILYDGAEGYVKSKFMEEISELPYSRITKEDRGEGVLAFKKGLHKLGYIKSDDINMQFDQVLDTALIKLQLINGVEVSPDITPEIQALMEWGMLKKSKSGYVGTETDADTGLTVSIFCWDSDGTLYEADQAVKLKISYAVQAAGGQGPYTYSVRKSLSGGEGGEAYGDEVTNPFSHIWDKSTDTVYVYVTATDAAGNTVTACAPFRYVLPERYAGE